MDLCGKRYLVSKLMQPVIPPQQYCWGGMTRSLDYFSISF